MMSNYDIKQTWKALKTNKNYLAAGLLIELIFLVVVAQVHMFYFIPSAKAATEVGSLINEEVAKLSTSEVGDLDSILKQNPEFVEAYRGLLKNIILFFLTIFAAWLLFKGPAWYFSYKQIHKKVPFVNLWLKFALLSLFWFFIIIAIISIMSMINGTVLPLLSDTVSTVILWILFTIIAYFATISFSLLPATQTFKKTFVLGTKYAKKLVLTLIINALLILVGFAVPIMIGKLHVLASLPVIILVTVPTIMFARYRIILATWTCLKK